MDTDIHPQVRRYLNATPISRRIPQTLDTIGDLEKLIKKVQHTWSSGEVDYLHIAWHLQGITQDAWRWTEALPHLLVDVLITHTTTSNGGGVL
jgi:hypothetical protein